MYASGNPKTKSELRKRIASGEQVCAFQPGGIFPGERHGQVTVEGPHYPAPHRWWARVEIRDGVILRVVS